MKTRNRTRGTARATVVLCTGLVAAGGLLWAALGVLHAPRLESEAALSRLAGDVADGIVAEWGRVLRGEDLRSADVPEGVRGSASLPAPPLGDVLSWMPGLDDVLVVPAPHDVRASRASQSTPFEALLAEARRLEVIEGKPEEALSAVLRALGNSPDDDARAEGRLRVIQLAVKCRRSDVVGEQWQQALAELSGNEALDDTSVLLLCGLAMVPALTAAEGNQAYAELSQRWLAGQLALPDPADAFVADARDAHFGTLRVPSRREALRQRLIVMNSAGGAVDPRWALDAKRRRVAGLLAFLGSGALESPLAGRWQVHQGPRPFLWYRDDGGGIVGFFCTFDALGGQFAERLQRSHLLPDGFSADFTGADESSGPVVRARTPLLGDDLGFVLRHRDPQAYLSAERRRAAWLRAGLLLTAAFTAVAALSTARALRRERALVELKSAFVASVSHELRTPVASILLMAENMESGRVGEETTRHRYPALIRREAQRLRRLVDDVLDVSRLERGDGPRVRPEDVGLRAFLDDMIAEARELVERGGGEWHCESAAVPESASLDTDAVRRAVLNLVDNALRHSGSRDVTLSVRVSGAELLLAVADRGRGIDGRERERLFEPFERLAADGRGVPGAGLGLSIVRGIARGHGGDVTVHERVPGPGSEFVLRLPVLDTEPMARSAAPDTMGGASGKQEERAWP